MTETHCKDSPCWEEITNQSHLNPPTNAGDNEVGTEIFLFPSVDPDDWCQQGRSIIFQTQQMNQMGPIMLAQVDPRKIKI